MKTTPRHTVGLVIATTLIALLSLPNRAQGFEVWFGDAIVSPLPASTTGTALAVGHFDSDVYFDCAVGANQGAGRSLLIYHGDGTGIMTLGEQIAGPTSQAAWTALVAGDFNGDGRDDLAGSREPTGIYYQEIGGFVSDPDLVYLNGAPERYDLLVAADMDDDGYDDLICLEPKYSSTNSLIYIYWGGSAGVEVVPTVLRVRLYPEAPFCELGDEVTWSYAPRARDVNGDGELDVAVNAIYSADGPCEHRNGIGWFENLGSREFAPEATWALVWEPTFWSGIDNYDFGHIDGDAYPDLVRSEFHTFDAYTYLGDATQTFILLGPVEPGFSANPNLFDANLDGILDLRTHQSATKVFRGVGDGTFEPVEALPGLLQRSQSCDVIPLGGPDLLGIGDSSTSIRVFPNVTGTTAGVEAIERAHSSLRATPSVSAAGVRLELSGVLKGVNGSGPTVVSIVGADGSRIRELGLTRVASGAWTAEWDGRDATGRRVPAGVFFARVDGLESAARFTIVR